MARDVQMGPITLKQPLPLSTIEQIDPFLLIHHLGPKTQEANGKNVMDIGAHPHRGFEPVTFIFKGEVHHRDSRGNNSIIAEGGVQVMSAGTGIFHSEYNKNKDQAVKFLQIWLSPNNKNVTPRYDQITLKNIDLKNRLYQILSPNHEDEGVWIHQNAWFHMGALDKGFETTYDIRDKGNGVYVFVLQGDVSIDGQSLNKRDGYGIWDTDKITIKADGDARVLLMDVPMSLS